MVFAHGKMQELLWEVGYLSEVVCQVNPAMWEAHKQQAREFPVVQVSKFMT